MYVCKINPNIIDIVTFSLVYFIAQIWSLKMASGQARCIIGAKILFDIFTHLITACIKRATVHNSSIFETIFGGFQNN